jgi:hypothetical protein
MSIILEKASSLSEFLKITSRIVADWSTPELGEVRPWYRGQKRADWGLVPGEYRLEDISPDELRSEFILKAHPLLNQVPANDWEWYFLMQHYGLPTRLLDWTTGSMIALHFALCHDTGKHDAAVWMLDPWSLNQTSFGKPNLVLTSDKEASGYLGTPYRYRLAAPHAIAIIPPYNSARITVQRGAFTVHGKDKRGLEAQFPKKLVRIVLPKDNCVEIRRELRNAGISEFTLFPDLDGLCRDIIALEIEGC